MTCRRSTLALLAVTFCAAAGQPEVVVATPAASATAADRTGMAVTVYNANLGLVKERRKVRLAKGVQDLAAASEGASGGSWGCCQRAGQAGAARPPRWRAGSTARGPPEPSSCRQS